MIYLGADHGGFEAKLEVEKFLIDQGFEVEDLGTHSLEVSIILFARQSVIKSYLKIHVEFFYVDQVLVFL